MSASRTGSAPLPFDPAEMGEDAGDGVARVKSAQAFRTISEVSEELDIPAHVLRFWETKFPALTPMKRGGGRRYYRPADMALLKGIRALLYDEGLTIKGLQKMLRERGAKHVMAIGEGTETPMIAEDDAPAGSEAAAAPQSAVPQMSPAGAGLAIEAVIARLERLRDRLRAAA